MANKEDVVVYLVREDNSITSYGRGTESETLAFVARPKWPAKVTDRFIAVNDWGHGQVVAAYDENLLGLAWREVKAAVQRVGKGKP